MSTTVRMYDLQDGHELVGEEKSKAISDGIATRVVVEIPECVLSKDTPTNLLQARIAELEQMVRELVEVTGAEYHVVAGDQYHMLCPGSAIKLNTNAAWIVALYGDRSAHKTKERVANIKAARSKAIALLQPEAGKEVGK